MSSCWTASIKMRHLRDNIVLLTALEGGDLNGMLQESEAWMGESFESILCNVLEVWVYWLFDRYWFIKNKNKKS